MYPWAEEDFAKDASLEREVGSWHGKCRYRGWEQDLDSIRFKLAHVQQRRCR
jgi:hypothetical protein